MKGQRRRSKGKNFGGGTFLVDEKSVISLLKKLWRSIDQRNIDITLMEKLHHRDRDFGV